MADFYLKSGAGAVERTNGAVVALAGKIIIARADVTANYLVIRKWVWECTTAGTTGAAVPAWPAAVTQDTTTVTDGTVVWTARRPGFSSGTTAAWAFAHIYADFLATATAAGDTIYVSNNHAESIAGAITATFPGTNASPTRLLCGNDAAAPPTAMATTGVIKTSGDFSLTFNGAVYVDGLTLIAGDAATGTTYLFIGNDNVHQHYVNCSLQSGTSNSSAGGRIAFASPGGGGQDMYATLLLENCSMKTNNASTFIYSSGGKFEWRGGSFLTGSATPEKMFGRNSAGATVLIDGVDFSALASTLDLGADNSQGAGYGITYRNCKLPASWAGSINPPDRPFTFADIYNCDSTDTNYRLHTSTYEGTVKSETTIVKTSGASDGTTALSWKMATTANAEYPLMLLTSPEIAFWNDTTAAAKTLTVEAIHDSATLLKDDEVWLEVVYLGTAGFPLGSYIKDSKASPLATAADQTASTVAWDGATITARANATAYVVGNVYKVGTNAGRIFFCTVAGTSAAAEPAGLATAIDGGAVADGTATFRAAVRQKLAVTLTPQEKGYYLARVKMAKASYTAYVDPLIVVT